MKIFSIDNGETNLNNVDHTLLLEMTIKMDIILVMDNLNNP